MAIKLREAAHEVRQHAEERLDCLQWEALLYFAAVRAPPPDALINVVIYRMRTYRIVDNPSAAAFHQFFRDWLLPVQRRHGARLVGRWETDDGRIVAVWEYDDREAYERIQAAVNADPDALRAQEYRRSLPKLFSETDEVFMWSTV